jgi:hypothetical protein
MQSISIALDRVEINPRLSERSRSILLNQEPEIVSGCPNAPTLYDPVFGPAVGNSVFENVGRIVSEPSPYVIHVYVLPEGEISRVVGGHQYLHLGAEEQICEGDVCYEATTGLYVSPAELNDQMLLVKNIEFALGLR